MLLFPLNPDSQNPEMRFGCKGIALRPANFRLDKDCQFSSDKRATGDPAKDATCEAQSGNLLTTRKTKWSVVSSNSGTQALPISSRRGSLATSVSDSAQVILVSGQQCQELDAGPAEAVFVNAVDD